VSANAIARNTVRETIRRKLESRRNGTMKVNAK